MEQYGGKMIDYGTYGCVFSSSLQCKNKKAPQVKEDAAHPPISKLISTEHAEVEYKISSLIRQIPLWKNYFAVSESICEPAKKQTERGIADCPVLEEQPLSKFRILSMTYHGVPIDAFRVNLKTFHPIAFISHLLEAGALLTLSGVVHRDIHRGNILVDQHHVPRFIDFNLSVFAKELVTEDMLSHQHTIHVGQEPPDSTIVNAISHGYDGTRVMNSILTNKAILKKVQTLLGVSPQHMKSRLTRFYQQSKSVKEGDIETWFKLYWTKYDSWGIGMNIVYQIIKWSIFPDFSIESHKAKLYPILRKMCEVSPVDRIDCVQALHQWNPNHFILQRYGKEWLKEAGTGMS
jgi:serine/threonine protein kinase